MAPRASTLLRRLEKLRDDYGPGGAEPKLELLRQLERRRLRSAAQVERLHELLCFLHAYPDDAPLLRRVRRMLDAFGSRSDLRKQAEALADSGIAGTATRYRFYWAMARWLTRRWPQRLSIDWDEFERQSALERLLDLLVAPAEVPAVDELALPVREWVDRLKGVGETDATFLVRRFEALRMDEPWRERMFEELDVPFVLAPGNDTPSRTRARYAAAPIVFQGQPLSRERPDLRRAARRRPRAVLSLSAAQGRRLVDLAREAMVTRSRDLDAFAHADATDVRMFDWGDGLQFAVMGTRPERRLLLEAVYGFLTLKNGVPIGYVLASGLFRSSEVAYNVFETYRSAEAARVYGRVLATARELFGSDVFSVDPYQLGHDNAEGLATGAWWFYQKLGFRPRDAGVLRQMRRELRRLRADSAYRSSEATLQQLSAEYVFYFLGRDRDDVLGLFPLSAVAARASRFITERFGSDREAATRVCSREAAQRFGVRSLDRFTRGQRAAWNRWGPLLCILPGVERWSAAERSAAVAVVRAKGGPRESEFVRLLNRHRKLWRGLVRLGG